MDLPRSAAIDVDRGVEEGVGEDVVEWKRRI